MVFIDAKVILNICHHLIVEGDILTVGVGPTVVASLWGDENGSVTS